jgi:hypothetical protein
MTDLLGSSWLQGIGVIFACVGVTSGIVFEIRRRSNAAPRSLRYDIWDLADSSQHESYVTSLSESIRNAKRTIYRSGRGFTSAALRKEIQEVVNAERIALTSGVEIIRIQKAATATEIWADEYASLLETYQPKLRVFKDFEEAPLVLLGLIDAYSDRPVVQLMFESEELVPEGVRHHASMVIFLYDTPALAQSLQRQFVARIKNLPVMGPDAIRRLSSTHSVYFAYGSNMSSRQLLQRCPAATVLGPSILYGWQRSFSVPAPHLGGTFAAGIERAADERSSVEGVAYELTAEDVDSLNAIELGGYKEEKVAIKIGPEHVQAFTHAPLRAADHSGSPSPEYLSIVREGATEHGLRQALAELDCLP